MSRVFNLSYIVDKEGKKRIDLIGFSNLEELDNFSLFFPDDNLFCFGLFDLDCDLLFE